MPMLAENPVQIPVEKLSLGCPILDRVLGGGIPFGIITEISGESSAGKTQLCLQILLSAASSGDLSAFSLFISTSPPFPLRRLLSLSSSPSPLDKIFIRIAFSSQELFHLLDHVDNLLSLSLRSPIRLLVIDSAAAIFHWDGEEALHRAAQIFAVAAKLKEQARRFNLAVIVTNHVVDVVEEEGRDVRVGNYVSLWSSGRRVCPAMGIAWANCVNMRIFLSRSGEEGKLGRKLQVVFAPHLPEGSCEFVIAREGVFGLGGSVSIPTLQQ